jgi:2-polyprenyl-3-methyl-5-hydroxy-6-metoxy-1,4-benzoquinol methylase/glycosyltransferase involved in cell wall biosynthesis
MEFFVTKLKNIYVNLMVFLKTISTYFFKECKWRYIITPKTTQKGTSKMSEIKYQGIIDLSVKNNAHTMAYEFIDKVADSRSLQILEVGCSTGYFGSALKAAGHIVWGIEPNKASAFIASQNLDHVFVGFVEAFIETYPDKKFDVITFGDVLEHIAEPSEVLNQCQSMLVEGGAIVASVPNVAHIAIRSMLLEGRWEYGDLGILDKTHLRFFTKQTIQDLFYDSGYSVVEISGVKLTAEAAAGASDMQLNQSAATYVDNFASDDHKYDFQYVLLAVPAGTRQGYGSRLLLDTSPIKILGLVHDVESSIVDVRLRLPLNAWASACDGEVQIKNHKDCDEQIISWADIIIIQRVANLYSIKILEEAKRLGKKVIFEIDDLLIELPDFLSHHKVGLIGYSNFLDRILPQVDCITVTTKRLAKQFEMFSRPIAVIPNTAENESLVRADANYWLAGQATLIVASSDAVMVDFIVPAISEIIGRKDIDVKVVVIGPPGEAFEKAGMKFDRVPNLSYSEFKKFIRTLHNPIGIIPLDDSLFSSCKSPIKYFDYSLAGMPVICSNVPPYSDVVKDRNTGILVTNDTVNWIAAIEQLVQSVSLRKTIAEQAFSSVERDYGMINTVRQWDLLFHKLRFRSHDRLPSTVTSSPISSKFELAKHLLAHLLSYHSYKAAIRILKRDGWKGFTARLLLSFKLPL